MHEHFAYLSLSAIITMHEGQFSLIATYPPNWEDVKSACTPLIGKINNL